MSDDDEIGGGESRGQEPRIESLAHDLARAINRLDAGEREALRDAAVAILRDTAPSTEPEFVEPPPAAPVQASFNPFGIAIPLGLVGALLVFLFPPIGLLMFGVAAMMVAWGVIATLFTRR